MNVYLLFRNHDADSSFFGYKTHIAVTQKRIITATTITTGEKSDGKELEALYNLVSLPHNCSNNLNQIAKRVNSTGNLYEEDVADLRERYGELWGVVSTVLGKLATLMWYSLPVNSLQRRFCE